jgi:hypothetical protein
VYAWQTSDLEETVSGNHPCVSTEDAGKVWGAVAPGRTQDAGATRFSSNHMLGLVKAVMDE